MEKLKKHIIRYFILFAFVLSIVESILDSIFDEVTKYIKDNKVYMIALVMYIILCISAFILFSIWFAITINKKIEEETKRQIHERNSLYANIVHDIKSPMTIILGFAQSLKDKRVKEEERDELIKSIYEKAKKVDNLINILFQYSKLNTRDYLMHLEQLDICRIVRDEVASVYEQFENKQMEVTVEIPDKCIMKQLDNVEFARTISNLLSNAYRHNENGCKVLIKLQEDHDKVKVIVADSGDPISKELEPKLFEPFVCADESRNLKGGNGLGLAIAKIIVEKHGGHIYIDSNIDRYTKGFVIEL